MNPGTYPHRFSVLIVSKLILMALPHVDYLVSGLTSKIHNEDYTIDNLRYTDLEFFRYLSVVFTVHE